MLSSAEISSWECSKHGVEEGRRVRPVYVGNGEKSYGDWNSGTPNVVYSSLGRMVEPSQVVICPEGEQPEHNEWVCIGTVGSSTT